MLQPVRPMANMTVAGAQHAGMIQRASVAAAAAASGAVAVAAGSASAGAAFRHAAPNMSVVNRLPNPPPPYPAIRPNLMNMANNGRLPVIPGGATVTAVPATIAGWLY